MTALPDLERELIRAAERAIVKPQPRARSRAIVGQFVRHTALLAMFALTLAVCAGALIVLGGHQRRQQTASASPPSREQLIDALAVLRRPQTPADRGATLPSPFYVPVNAPAPLRAALAHRIPLELRRAGNPTIDRPLVRMIRTPSGDEISVVPETWQPSPSSRQRAEGIVIAIHTPGNSQGDDTGPTPISTTTFLTHGLAIFNDTRRGAVLVPDGVARIALLGFQPIKLRVAHGITQMISINNSKIAGMTSSVHHNVATFTLAGLTATSPLHTFELGGSAAARLIWFDAAGRVIRHTTTSFSELYITVRRDVTTGSKRQFCAQNPKAC